jgi:hypothetical protein
MKINLNYYFKVYAEIPQPFDYVGRGFTLQCYECHSNRPGCGAKVDWILSRWKTCDMPKPKCVKIIEKNGPEETESKLNFQIKSFFYF